jgi:hypothetical protein
MLKCYFRIHWDGDFFNDTYAYAWKTVIENNTDVQFWVYTRVKSAALILKDISNLSLYYSTDDENKEIGHELKRDNGIRLAYLREDIRSHRKCYERINGQAWR